MIVTLTRVANEHVVKMSRLGQLVKLSSVRVP